MSETTRYDVIRWPSSAARAVQIPNWRGPGLVDIPIRVLNEIEPMVKCQGCGVLIRWTGIYGDWCATCKPRILP